MFTLLLVYCISGLILSALAIPLLAGKVKPNPIYGFRVPATLQDPELWYATNRYFARWQFAVGLIEVIASIGFYQWPGISVDAYALACLAVFVLAFGISLVEGFRYMQNLGR